jgi:hypothetical protein
MATSVKIRESTKIELERLQAEILLETNKKFSQQDLLDMLIKFGHDNIDDLMERTIVKSISDDDINDIESLSSSWGVETSPDMIDEVIYGVKK